MSMNYILLKLERDRNRILGVEDQLQSMGFEIIKKKPK